MPESDARSVRVPFNAALRPQKPQGLLGTAGSQGWPAPRLSHFHTAPDLSHCSGVGLQCTCLEQEQQLQSLTRPKSRLFWKKKRRVLLTDLVAQNVVVSPRGTAEKTTSGALQKTLPAEHCRKHYQRSTAENTTSGVLQRGATAELELNSATKPVFDDSLSLSGGTDEARVSRVARGRKDNLCDV